MAKFNFILALRIVQIVLSLVVLGLSGFVAHWYNVDTLTPSPSQINFLLFAAVLSILSAVCIEVVGKVFPRVSPWPARVLEVTNTLFFFAGFIALGVFLSQLLFCRGTVCAAAQADTAFAAFLFCTWGTTTFLALREAFKGGFRKPQNAAHMAGIGAGGNYRDEVPVPSFAGYEDLPPAAYRPSVEMARTKEVLAWDRRIAVPVTRPGSWHGDPWLADKADEGGWDAIELSKLPPAAGNQGVRR